MSLHPPLNLPYIHNVHDGTPIPIFTTTERHKEVLEKHKSRPDDIYIATYQKSGTTWTQHIVNQLLDEPQGKDLRINEAVRWLEVDEQANIDNMVSPRVIKTHSKLRWLPKPDGAKYIYIYRNPKDVAVSYYFHKLRYGEHFRYEDTCNNFVRDVFLPKNGSVFGNYFDHVVEWLTPDEKMDILYLTYEDMVEDLPREVKRIADFLGCSLPEEKLKTITNDSSFNAMKENLNVNYSWMMDIPEITKMKKDDPNYTEFLRKGKVGDWIDHLSPEHSKEIEKLVEKYLIPVGAKIRYILQ